MRGVASSATRRRFPGWSSSASSSVAAVAANFVAPYNYATQDITQTTLGIGSPGHLLGTDRLGRDILSRIIYGTRISLAVGLVVPLMIVLIGVPVGLIAGYKGGWVDTFSMRVVDVFYAIPNLLFIIIFMTYLKAKFQHVTGGLAAAVEKLRRGHRRDARRLHRPRPPLVADGLAARARAGALAEAQGVR